MIRSDAFRLRKSIACVASLKAVEFVLSTHGGRGVELLRNGDKRDLLPIEHLNKLGEIHRRSEKPVDLVNDHAVDPPSLDIRD